MSTVRVSELTRIVRPHYDDHGPAHRFDHIERVLAISNRLAQEVGPIDREALFAMVLLHDIVRFEDHQAGESAKASAELGAVLLASQGFDEHFIEKVTSGVRSHSTSSLHPERPVSLEARLLYDADKLDALGEQGIERWLSMCRGQGLTPAQAAWKYLDLMARLGSEGAPFHTVEANRLYDLKHETTISLLYALIEQETGRGALETVVLVDAGDRVLGVEEKLEAHRKGLLHQGFSVFIVDEKGCLLLQQRASTKYHSPSLWTVPCCGHPRPGESSTRAARRRLREEMGLDAELVPAFSGHYRAEFPRDGLCEHERGTVFCGRVERSLVDIEPDSDEAQGYRWISLTTLKVEMSERPENFTAWFQLMLAPIAQYLSANRPDYLPQGAIPHYAYANAL